MIAVVTLLVIVMIIAILIAVRLTGNENFTRKAAAARNAKES